MLEKSLEFVLFKENNLVLFNLSFVLLLTEIKPILEKQNYKKDAFIAYDTSYIKIIFTMLIKVIILYAIPYNIIWGFWP